MGAPKRFDDETRRWIASLAQEHGPRPAVRLASERIPGVTLGQVNRCYAEFYPRGAPPPAPASGPPFARQGPSAPAAYPQLDQELLDAAGSPEKVLLVSLQRAARFTAGADQAAALRALERVERLAQQLARIQREKRLEEAQVRRQAILILEPEDAPL